MYNWGSRVQEESSAHIKVGSGKLTSELDGPAYSEEPAEPAEPDEEVELVLCQSWREKREHPYYYRD